MASTSSRACVPLLPPRRWSSSSSPSSSSQSTLPPVYVSHVPHLVPYPLGLALQEALYSLRGSPEVLLLLEHTSVFTEGRRGPEEQNEDEVRKGMSAIGADYQLTQRGGLITYHGPGQLVGYPILHLGKMELTSRCYVDRLQSSLISLLHSYSLPTVPPPSEHTGVWSDINHKIVSIGVQVRHRITTHGFALNVTRDVVPWFNRIVACGIKGKSMTNMQDQLTFRIKSEEESRPDLEAAEVKAESEKGIQTVEDEAGRGEAKVGPETEQLLTVQEVAPKAAQHLMRNLGRQWQWADEGLLRYEADNKNVLRRVWVQGKEVNVAPVT